MPRVKKTKPLTKFEQVMLFLGEPKVPNDYFLKLTINGQPVTKKNHSRIVKIGKYTRLLPSKQYEQYEKIAIIQIQQTLKELLAETETEFTPLDEPLNIAIHYYIGTKRVVDISNLISATDDILTRVGVIADDNCTIVTSHDLSAVRYDKDNPRTEIFISKIKGNIQNENKTSVE